MQLREHQLDALEKLSSGKILAGGVGSGKSLTALAYYLKHHAGEKLLIITTAKKRDSKEWIEDAMKIGLVADLTIDSWNNIGKYEDFSGFAIFDEQRVVGSGAWVKSFLKIARKNPWVLLSGTPGDTWLDYLPVFLANGFFKNKTEFTRQHVVYNTYAKFPQVDHYIGHQKLERLRREVLVLMPYEKHTTRHIIPVEVGYDAEKTRDVMKRRWDVFKDEPIQNAGVLCYVLRRITNESPERCDRLRELVEKHSRVVVFYNFTYEVEAIRALALREGYAYAEWNGQRHEEVPVGDRWLYAVQYTAGSEGWNCVTTNCEVFYSQTYSYKAHEQAMGRIDRLNTPYTDLYYYLFRSSSKIDLAIKRALEQKKNFNSRGFAAKILGS